MTLAQLSVNESAVARRRLVRASDVLWRSIPGTGVMLLRAIDDVVILSGTGLALWEELAVPRCLDEVTTVFADRYGVTPDEVAHGLGDVLEELARRGFLLVHHDD